jgi:hypothetical protein
MEKSSIAESVKTGIFPYRIVYGVFRVLKISSTKLGGCMGKGKKLLQPPLTLLSLLL